MSTFRRSGLPFRPSLSLVLLLALLAVLWFAGGASRPDAFGQVVVRSASAILLVVFALFGERPSLEGARPVLIFLLLAFLLAVLQLLPLPPNWWLALPGRSAFAEAAMASGQGQPWRPLAIVPGAAVNAAASLIVPAAALFFVAGLKEEERSWLPGLLLSVVVASMFMGLLQLSGAGFDNPLINDVGGQVGGSFANRNHFALFLAFGCLLAPVWAFLNGRQSRWRAPVALGLTLLLPLTILASGSRAGMLLGALALCLGFGLTAPEIRKALRRYPRWVFPALIVAILAVLAVFVLAAVAADRALSIDRVIENDPGQDMRARALPTMLEMVRIYFPAGAGLGGFDPMFRVHEPFSLLKLTYFNHAHNDWLEVVLDAGLPGLLLLAAAVAWWGWASVRAWRAGQGVRHALPKLGSAMIFFVFVASVFDYPARVPMIMAAVVVAGFWLGQGRGRGAA